MKIVRRALKCRLWKDCGHFGRTVLDAQTELWELPVLGDIRIMSEMNRMGRTVTVR